MCNEVQHRFPDSLVQTHSVEHLECDLPTNAVEVLLRVNCCCRDSFFFFIFCHGLHLQQWWPGGILHSGARIPQCRVLWSHTFLARVIASLHLVLRHAQWRVAASVMGRTSLGPGDSASFLDVRHWGGSSPAAALLDQRWTVSRNSTPVILFASISSFGMNRPKRSSKSE